MARLRTLAPRVATLPTRIVAAPPGNTIPGSWRDGKKHGKGRFYDLRIWRDHIRPQKLRRNPLCEDCLDRHLSTIATDVDHIDGDSRNNLAENHRSLCHSCHSTKTGSSWRISNDLFYPMDIKKPAIPVTIVAGPPAAGKSTFVEANKSQDDIVIDLDSIVQEVCGNSRNFDRSVRLRALSIRNERLRSLSTETPGKRAWFITTSPRGWHRTRWASLLFANVLLVRTPRHVCLSRIDSDPHRRRASLTQRRLIENWFTQFSPASCDETPGGMNA